MRTSDLHFQMRANNTQRSEGLSRDEFEFKTGYMRNITKKNNVGSDMSDPNKK